MTPIAAQRRSTKLLLLSLTLCSSRLWADAPQVCIGILSGQKSIFVSSAQPFLFRESSQGKMLAPANAGSVWRMTIDVGNKKPAVAVLDGEGRMIAAVPSVSVVAASDATVRLWSTAEYKSAAQGKAYRGALIVRARGQGLQVVNLLNLEDYLLGVVPSEMSPSSPPEALKAQAIAARSKALANLSKHKTDGFHLCATEHCQAYGSADFEKDSTTQAVHDTRGVVLTYKGKIVDAVYSTTCGGMTANSEDVWLKNPVPYLRSVADSGLAQVLNALGPLPLTQLEGYFKLSLDACCKPADGNGKNFRWTREISWADIERWANAQKKIGKLVGVTVLERALGGRIKQLAIDGEDGSLTLAGDGAIRQFFRDLPSSAFIVETLKDVGGKGFLALLWGAGWGHGVGMCQEGAVNLARNGWTAEAILKHYFTDVQSQTIF
jgi:SpoIID/LytB domain protein